MVGAALFHDVMGVRKIKPMKALKLEFDHFRSKINTVLTEHEASFTVC